MSINVRFYVAEKAFLNDVYRHELTTPLIVLLPNFLNDVYRHEPRKAVADRSHFFLNDVYRHERENIKNMGQTMGRLNKTLVSNLEENNALNMQIKKNISSVVGLTKFLPMLLISNLALIAFLIFDKFF